MGRFSDGISVINRGLDLKPVEPEKAYFNRAIAREALNDLQGAYEDYRMASELKPSWLMPQQEMARFVVHKKTAMD
jgi:hypothetical protein